MTQQTPLTLGLILAVLLTVGAAVPASADAAAEGREIMAESERRDDGWVDGTSKMEMYIRRADGREVVRRVRNKSLEGDSGEDKSLLIFDEPADVRGTVFLTHSKPMASDDQWIFLPSLKRVKRISSKRKTGRFMGSEFTYEDLEAFSLDKNDYQYLGDVRCGEPAQDCFKVELRPKDPYSGYEKTVVQLDKAHYRSHHIEFYSKRTGKLAKTLTFHDYQLLADKFWRPGRMLMRNELSGDVTELVISDQQLGVGLKDREFRKSALERRQ